MRETPAKQTMQKTAAAQALPPGGLQMASRRLEPGWEALQALTDPIPTADAVRSCPAAREGGSIAPGMPRSVSNDLPQATPGNTPFDAEGAGRVERCPGSLHRQFLATGHRCGII
jgi:hypothetical protein